jgi:hypothetical protein
MAALHENYSGEAEPRYMKRKVKAGKIEADFELRALIVHYEVEATVLGDRGEAMQVEKKALTKRIRLKTLNENTNVPLLAEEIVESCTLIHDSKLPLVEELLYKLQQHSMSEANGGERRARKEKRRKSKKSSRDRDRDRDGSGGGMDKGRGDASGPPLETATLDKIDDYMEKLYDDDMKEKVKGTAMILELAKHAGNLEALIQNESLMGALSRVLKEDYKRSMDLVVNLMYIFFSFSNFSQLHGALLTNRIGNETMRVIELEIKRYALRMKEMQTMTRIAALQGRGEEVPAELWAALQSGRKKSSRKRRGGSEGKSSGGGEDSSQRGKSKERERRIDIERERSKVRQFIKKQDKLLFVCFHILMNIAEDVQIERKVVKRKCVEFLSAVLDRTNAELLILSVNFLKKLSIFEENKNRMVEAGVVPKLVKFIPCSNKALMQSVCRLLLNLSFDGNLRDQMVKSSLIPKMVDLLKHAPFRQISLKILYHLSMDDRCKSMFTYTDSIPITMQLLVNFPNSKIPIELVALTINLSHNARNAELLCKDGGLKKLFHRVLRYRDVLLMKVLRNVSQYTYDKTCDADNASSKARVRPGEGNKDRRRKDREGKTGDAGDRRRGKPSLWAPYVNDLFKLCKQAATENADLLLEALGTMANLTANDLPPGVTFADLIVKFQMVEFLQRQLVPGMSQDDIVLVIIQLVGAFATEHEAARVLVGSPIIKSINDVMRAKRDDDEIALQTLWAFLQIVSYDDTYESLVYDTNAIDTVCSCLGNRRNNEVRAVADEILVIVMDRDRVEVEVDMDDSDDDEFGSERSDSEDDSGDEGKSGERRGRQPSKKRRAVVRRLGELGRKIREQRYKMHNQEWLRWANEKDMEAIEGDEGQRFRMSHSDDSHGGQDSEDLDDSGQWNVGSLGRHEMVQMVGLSEDEEDDFLVGGGYGAGGKFEDAAMY